MPVIKCNRKGRFFFYLKFHHFNNKNENLVLFFDTIIIYSIGSIENLTKRKKK